MGTVLITGVSGLIGSEAALHFGRVGLDVVGVDNDMRREFFGPEASTEWNRARVTTALGAAYRHEHVDVRDRDEIDRIFRTHAADIALVIHCAAQPSHDWAARAPFVDFDINAVGTLNVLEATRRHAADAAFIFTSTNKVYGDRPNDLQFVELETRWELEASDPLYQGITEDMSIDASLHSLFGASKVAADVLVQEYGRYFGLKTVCFRGGTLTGPQHSATELHGFLAYLVRCALAGVEYTIFGYKGKQVRDAIHSADLVRCFEEFYRAPRVGEVYNIGGGRMSNCSVREAIDLVERRSGKALKTRYESENRVGDHIWYVTDNTKFETHYPSWALTYDIERIVDDICESATDRWSA